MKRLSALAIAAIAVTFVGSDALAQTKLSANGGAHNFTDDVYGGGRDPGAGFYETDWNTTGEICQPCHTPHGSSVGTMAAGLLWSHQFSTNTTWNMYTSSSLQGGGATEPQGWDKLCLSCHDGTTGVDAFAHNTYAPAGTGTLGGGSVFITNAMGGNVWGYDTWAKNPGPGLHPISVDYDADTSGANGLSGLRDKSATAMGVSGNIVDVLYNGNLVGCASCHDVHGDQVPAGAEHLLRVDNAASALCLTCHDK